MSWAGKKTFRESLRSLFHPKNQAPSFSANRQPAAELPEEELARLDPVVKAWVQDKGYRRPDPTIEAAAVRMGMDSRKLHQYALARFGLDFRTWRSRLRIRDAQEALLQEPAIPASVIARRVGYNDRSNFARHFKEATGMTPAQWRRENAPTCGA